MIFEQIDRDYTEFAFSFNFQICVSKCEQCLIVTCAYEIENLIPREDLFRGCGLISVTGRDVVHLSTLRIIHKYPDDGALVCLGSKYHLDQ